MVKKDRICAIIPLFKPAKKDVEQFASVIPARDLIVIINDDGMYPNFGKAHRIDPKENLGFAGGVNRGIIAALSVGAEWVVVFNQDMRLNSNSWRNLTSRLTKLAPGVYGPLGGTLDKRRFTSVLDDSGNSEVVYISGSCIVIHRKVIETAGYFFEPYFMYYEDVDYCVRARKYGFPVKLLPVPGIIHYHRPVIGMGSGLHEFYLARNHWLFMKRLAPLSVRLLELIRLPLTILSHLLTGNIAGILGVLHGLVGIGGRKDRL